MTGIGPAHDGGRYAAETIETHSGVVFFAGDRAYKLKKAVDLGFLDFTTRASRLAACQREVELNRRLAPDVYLGVADVVDPAGRVCDHLVVMRRLPAERRLSTLIRSGSPAESIIDEIARLVADFHARAARSAEANVAASADTLARRWAMNTAALRPFAKELLDASEIELVDALAARYLDGRHALFDERIAAGRARDGHGDLLADDIFCLDDGPRILDCIEFDDALRLDDVLADVAFLAMDLERLGQPHLAERFLATYRSAARDDWPASLAHHHIAHRAHIRAKVTAIRADQGVPEAAEEARRLLALTRSHLETARIRLVLVGGLPGTGKSTVAAGIADAVTGRLVRSDVVRKQLAGLMSDRPAPTAFREGIYAPQFTVATYRELLRRARHALTHGETVILDASWSDEARRAQAHRLAVETASDLVEFRCVAPEPVAAARIAARATAGGDASDADRAVAAAMAVTTDPWPTAVALDTVPAPAAVLDAALRHVRAVRRP